MKQQDLGTAIILVQDLTELTKVRNLLNRLGLQNDYLSGRPYPFRVVVTEYGKGFIDMPVVDDPLHPNTTIEDLEKLAQELGK